MLVSRARLLKNCMPWKTGIDQMRGGGEGLQRKPRHKQGPWDEYPGQKEAENISNDTPRYLCWTEIGTVKLELTQALASSLG